MIAERACFQHPVARRGFEDLSKGTASDKILHEKAFDSSNPEQDGYQRGLASMVYKFLDIESANDTRTGVNFEHQQLVEELHKPIIKKF